MSVPKHVIDAAHRDARLKLIEERAFDILKVIMLTPAAQENPTTLFSLCYGMAKEFTEHCEKEREYAR